MSQLPNRVVKIPKGKMVTVTRRGLQISGGMAIRPPTQEVTIKHEDDRIQTQSGVRITSIKTIKPADLTPIKKHEDQRSQFASNKSGIRITSIKTIKPPNPESYRKHETGPRFTSVKNKKQPHSEASKKHEEKRLRAKVQKEIMSRSRSCAYTGFECVLPVLKGRQYCYRHILQDATAPYKQCVQSHPNGSRCQMPAPDDHRDRDPGLCYEHARASLYARHRSCAPPPPVNTTETLLHQLNHYVKLERHRTTSCTSSVSVVSEPADQEVPANPSAIDPFKQIDATDVNDMFSSSIMECGSASDSDADSVMLGPGGDCRGGHDEDLSDAEDAPCEETPLWKAGVYTAEEAVSQAKNSLKLLQAAYQKQMERLQVLLQTARLQYLRSLKAEKEQYCSINSQARSGSLTVRERRQLRKLKAFASYHRKHGTEAILARKLQQRRAKLNDHCPNRPIPSLGRCVFTEGSFRCPLHVIPASKHCRKHILQDRHQVLFSPCGDVRGVESCQEPVAKLPMPSLACRYHTDPPNYTVFTLQKDDSDSDTASNSSTETSHSDLGESLPKEEGHDASANVDISFN